jgi:hypothetical protein
MVLFKETSNTRLQYFIYFYLKRNDDATLYFVFESGAYLSDLWANGWLFCGAGQ